MADKLKNRYSRFGTVTDRDYTITRYKTSGDRWDFDVEGGTPHRWTPRKDELKDIEEMLAAVLGRAWGDPNRPRRNLQASHVAKESRSSPVKRATIAPQKLAWHRGAPFEEKVYREADLRAMDYGSLLVMIKRDMELTRPATLTTTDAGGRLADGDPCS